MSIYHCIPSLISFNTYFDFHKQKLNVCSSLFPLANVLFSFCVYTLLLYDLEALIYLFTFFTVPLILFIFKTLKLKCFIKGIACLVGRPWLPMHDKLKLVPVAGVRYHFMMFRSKATVVENSLDTVDLNPWVLVQFCFTQGKILQALCIA